VTNTFDAFSIQLLEESKHFLEKAGSAQEPRPFLHAALVLGFSALESHVNGVAEELSLRKNLSLLDEAVLCESALKLQGGEWRTTGETKYYRLEDRLAFLFSRFASIRAQDLTWWSVLHEAVEARNGLVHPRAALVVTTQDVQRFLNSIIEALDDLYRAVFRRGHPAHGRGLDSTMTF